MGVHVEVIQRLLIPLCRYLDEFFAATMSAAMRPTRREPGLQQLLTERASRSSSSCSKQSLTQRVVPADGQRCQQAQQTPRAEDCGEVGWCRELLSNSVGRQRWCRRAAAAHCKN